MATTGTVYLVGAGPGDPDLITLKGMACIEGADVIVYDYLASPRLLAFAAAQAEIIYVGKKGGDHTLPQDRINALLVEKALAGKTVTRLKGGDPFIFGRGGEEAEVLIAAGIPFEVVPGVTSAIAAPAYAGIPLTHRDYTSTLAFVTGHEDPTKEESSIDWASLAKGIGTLVFLMGIRNLPHIVARLREHGLPPEKPAAIVGWGTTPRQSTVTGTLSTIEQAAREARVKPPAVIVVGEVVRLREKMKWFEQRPLLGKRIVVTRAREQASELSRRLAALGAECLEFPTIKVVPPADWLPLDQAIDALPSYDWLIFTSVNGVNFFFQRLFARGLDVRSLGHLGTAAIGPATAGRLFDFGLKTDILPASYRAESVVEAFAGLDMKGKKVLLPRAVEARPVLPVELARQGASVTEAAAYTTVKDNENAGELLALLEAGEVDVITFTSSSTVRNFKEVLPPGHRGQLLEGVTVASIGPITSATAEELGFTVDITAGEFTIEGLCRAIEEHFAGQA